MFARPARARSLRAPLRLASATASRASTRARSRVISASELARRALALGRGLVALADRALAGSRAAPPPPAGGRRTPPARASARARARRRRELLRDLGSGARPAHAPTSSSSSTRLSAWPRAPGRARTPRRSRCDARRARPARARAPRRVAAVSPRARASSPAHVFELGLALGGGAAARRALVRAARSRSTPRSSARAASSSRSMLAARRRRVGRRHDVTSTAGRGGAALRPRRLGQSSSSIDRRALRRRPFCLRSSSARRPVPNPVSVSGRHFEHLHDVEERRAEHDEEHRREDEEHGREEHLDRRLHRLLLGGGLTAQARVRRLHAQDAAERDAELVGLDRPRGRTAASSGASTRVGHVLQRRLPRLADAHLARAVSANSSTSGPLHVLGQLRDRAVEAEAGLDADGEQVERVGQLRRGRPRGARGSATMRIRRPGARKPSAPKQRQRARARRPARPTSRDDQSEKSAADRRRRP